MIARTMIAAIVLVLPAAQAADLAVRAVVVKSARVSVQGHRINSPEGVQVTVVPADQARMRVVFTP